MTTETMTAQTLPQVGRGPAHAARIGWIRGRLEVKEFFRQRESVVFTLAFPIIMMFLFGTVVNYPIPGGIKFGTYFVPGIIASGLFGVAFQTVAIQIAIERDKGVLKRLSGTPMPPASYFIGKIIMVFVLVVLETLLLLVVASVLGRVTLPTDWHRWVTFGWVMVGGIASGSLLGIAFSSVPRSGKAAPAVLTPIALVLAFMSGIYFVSAQLPSYLQPIGAAFPLKWIAQGLRSVFLPASMAHFEAAGSWELPRAALILGAWTVGGLFLALRTFRWRSSKDS